MGKIIKGSPAKPERYTIPIPTIASPVSAIDHAAAPPADERDAFAGFEPILADSRIAAPPEPEPGPPSIDIDAIASQAQALVDEAQRNADAIVESAHERARTLVDEAGSQTAVIAEDARLRGHDEGYGAGAAAAQAEMSEMLATLRGLLESARAERHALFREAEPELVRLAVGIAERVLHGQIALDGGVVVEMAKAAIARIVDREKITVRVNPADVDRMREHRDELLALGDVKTMLVIEDQRVDRGGIVIETDGGSVDAKIATQLAEVRKILHIVDDIVVQPAALDASEEAAALAAARAS